MNKTLKYDKPSSDWFERMPIGCGRLGAMVSGEPLKETILLDEESVWAGFPADCDHPGAAQYLGQIRDLIFSGRYNEARELGQKHMTGFFNHYGTHLPAGSLVIDYDHGGSDISSYCRELDMARAVAKVGYQAGGVNYSREYFASHVDDVICIRLSGDKASAVNAAFSLQSENQNIEIDSAGDSLRMFCKCRDGGVDLVVAVKFEVEGGSYNVADGRFTVNAADSVIIFIDIQTSYRGKEYAAAVDEKFEALKDKSFERILNDHSLDFGSLFNRVDFKLEGPDFRDLTTGERFERFRREKDDLDLITKFFDMGRYLLISCSRRGSLAAHLQGVWNDNKAANMGWTCDYHLDINTQMNYWPAEVCNLSECHEPLFDLIKALVEPGRKTAQVHYGCRGWTAHAVTNLWGFTSPGISERWAFFPTGGLWAALHMVEHYRFTGDRSFLEQTAYPVLKEAADFFLDFLVEDPKCGYLVTCPATSEENIFQTPDGQMASVCAGPTCDNVLLRELFGFCIEASELLDVDNSLREKWKTAADRLPPFMITSDGRLQEWLEDFDEPEPEHRHISHLLGVYPYSQITPENTPELAEAARRVVEHKMTTEGWEAVGWNRSWNINIFAALGLGEKAYDNIMGLFDITASSLLTYHPPFATAEENIFEMDGNTGATAGIANMLLQSNNGVVRILPALPQSWKAGSIKGLRCCCGFEADIFWSEGKLVKAVIRSLLGNDCSLSYKQKRINFKTQKNSEYLINDKLELI